MGEISDVVRVLASRVPLDSDPRTVKSRLDYAAKGFDAAVAAPSPEQFRAAVEALIANVDGRRGFKHPAGRKSGCRFR